MDYFYASAWQGVAPGLQDAQLGVNFKTSKQVSMQLNYHYFATAAKLDDVKKGLGSEMDYQLDWNVMKDVKLSAGYSIMRGTKSMDVVKGGDHKRWQDWAKGAYDKVYPASITKIMTALLAFTNGNMDDVVTISEENVTLEEGSQRVGFQVGDQVTMDELVHCLLVYSGNDAASAIATHIGGTTENFVSMMNAYAASLGCTGTHFTNPHGLQDENHYTTPYDIYLMLKEALKYPEFTEITQLGSYTTSYKYSDGSDASVALTATDHYLTGEACNMLTDIRNLYCLQIIPR